jgi:3-oxoacyl-(acyl-carrier-protein) synthase/SAM-dependent methyltransferase/acyl carrier protein
MASDQQLENLSPVKRALYEIRQLRSRVQELERLRSESIAIIGMGLRFPGNASTPEALWNVLATGVDTVTEIPGSRWALEQFFDADADAPGKMYARHASLLADAALFDADFFGISPREAMALDPQHRLALEVSWEALENAGYNPAGLSQTSVGVYLALGNGDYGRLAFHDAAGIDSYTATGNVFSVAAGRISYALGLVGPSVALDTACSGSLVALHLACQSLRAGECRMALAGGVNLILSPEVSVNLSKSRMLARDGRCKTFDAAADGYVRAEGCGMVVLKRLSDAEADGDRILAIIRGSAVNQDGRSGGLTVPSGAAQESLIRQALNNAGIEPEQVSYVEAHGTGTALGDPIEAHALVAALGGNRNSSNPLVIGSVKTNLGHLEAASGIAGVIKTVLALQHEEIPAHLNFHKLNPHIDWNGIPVEIPVQARPWPRGPLPRLAGVSSFGFSGTNAHVIVEEAPVRESVPKKVERPLHLLAISARTESALNVLRDQYGNPLARSTESFADICYTANAGRMHFPERAAYVGASADDILREPIARGSVDEVPEIVFLFPAEGAEYAGMGKELFNTQPVFRQAMEECGVHDGGATHLFAVEYAVARLWQSWGIQPAALFGRGVGEYVAGCIGGAYSLAEGLQRNGVRGRTPQVKTISGVSGLQPYHVLVEVGPGTSVAALGKQRLGAAGRLWLPSLRRERGEWEQMLQSLAQLYVRGAEVDWQAFDSHYGRRRVALPTYPFERQRFWIDTKPPATIESPKTQWESVCEAASHQSRYVGMDLNVAAYPKRWAALGQLTDAYIRAALVQLGAFKTPGECHTASSLIESYGIDSCYEKLIRRWLMRLGQERLLRQEGDKFTAFEPLTDPDLARVRLETEAEFAGDRIFLDYVLRCGENLTGILTGHVNRLETIFPGGDFRLAEDLYERAPLAAYFGAIGRAALEAFVRTRRKGTFRVLEVGGGTGSTASALLPVLPAEATEYHFTDLSDTFLNHAKRKFGAYPFVRYGRLDIELDGARQSYPRGSFDILAATNVLHATRDIRSTVCNVKSLLAPGGILILCEATDYLPWFDVTTALIEGWQRFEDGVRGEHPLLAPESWKSVLLDAGFEAVTTFPEPGSPAEILGQRVVLAKVPGMPAGVHRTIEPAAAPVQADVEDPASVDVPCDLPWLRGRENLVSLMKRHIAEMLCYPAPESVERKRRLTDLGLDSLMALEFSGRMTKALKLERPLPSTLFFDYPTLDALADYLESDILHVATEAQPSNGPVDPMEARVEELESLADAEVEALLLKRLGAL